MLLLILKCITRSNSKILSNSLNPTTSVADPEHFDSDPDPAFRFDLAPDSTFHFDAAPDPNCFK